MTYHLRRGRPAKGMELRVRAPTDRVAVGWVCGQLSPCAPNTLLDPGRKRNSRSAPGCRPACGQVERYPTRGLQDAGSLPDALRLRGKLTTRSAADGVGEAVRDPGITKFDLELDYACGAVDDRRVAELAQQFEHRRVASEH
jgi:hypothetical protein